MKQETPIFNIGFPVRDKDVLPQLKHQLNFINKSVQTIHYQIANLTDLIENQRADLFTDKVREVREELFHIDVSIRNVFDLYSAYQKINLDLETGEAQEQQEQEFDLSADPEVQTLEQEKGEEQ